VWPSLFAVALGLCSRVLFGAVVGWAGCLEGCWLLAVPQYHSEDNELRERPSRAACQRDTGEDGTIGL
jgi:hypothetical protein